jgi:hypothetical protein
VRRARVARLPRALRQPGVRFDNIALVPASLLPHKDEYQAIADRLPRGSVLICLPKEESRQRQVLARVATGLRSRGRPVTTMPAARFNGQHARRAEGWRRHLARRPSRRV